MRVKRHKIKRKHRDMFRGSSYCSTFPPRLYTEEFPLCPYMTFHKGTSTEELQLQTWSTQLLSLTQSPLHKRKGTMLKQIKDYNLGDLMITNNTW